MPSRSPDFSRSSSTRHQRASDARRREGRGKAPTQPALDDLLYEGRAHRAGGSLCSFLGPTFTLLPGAQFLLPVTALIIIGDTLREFFSSLSGEGKNGVGGAHLPSYELFHRHSRICRAHSLPHRTRTRVRVGICSRHDNRRAHRALGAAALSRKLFSNFSSKLVLPIIRSAWPSRSRARWGRFLRTPTS